MFWYFFETFKKNDQQQNIKVKKPQTFIQRVDVLEEKNIVENPQ